MFFFLKYSKRIGAAAVLLAFAASAYAESSAGFGDPLQLPARQSARSAARLMTDIALLNESRLAAVGEQGTIILSNDKGKSWLQAQVPVSVNLTAVFFANAKSGWAAGHDGVILGTNDGGLTWSRLFDGNAANEQIVATAERRVKELRERAGAAAVSASAVAAAQSELERAEDALADAKAGARFGPARPLFSLWFKDARQGFVAGAFGQLFRTDDGGATWRYIGDRLDNPEGFHYNAIVPTPSGKIAVVGEGGVIHLSADGGKTWQRHETGYNGQLYGMLAFREAGDGEVFIAYGFGGRIFISRDGGSGWTEGSSGVKTSIVASFIAADGLPRLVGANGQILRSDDGKRFAADASPSAVTQKRIAAAVLLSDGTLVLAGTGGVHLVSKNEK